MKGGNSVLQGSRWEKYVFSLEKIKKNICIYSEQSFLYFRLDTLNFVSHTYNLSANKKVLFYIPKSWSELKLVVLQILSHLLK